MSKRIPNTNSFPLDLARAYHLAMNSKDNLSELEGLTNAKSSSLRKLFDELESIWNQNSIEKQQARLQAKYDELRKIQRQLEKNGQEFKNELSAKSKSSLLLREKDLISEKQKILSCIQNFDVTKETWRGNMRQTRQELKEKKKNIDLQDSESCKRLETDIQNWAEEEKLYKIESHLSQMRNEKLRSQLSPKKQLLKKKKDELTKKQQTLSQKLSELYSEQRRCQANITGMKSESERKSRQMKIESDQNLKSMKSNLEQNLKDSETSLLMQLKLEILAEHPESTPQSKDLLMQGGFSMLSRMLRDTNDNCEKRKRHLIPVLTRVGISLDEFLTKMESNARNSDSHPK